jgi:hypothetical protein
MASKIGPMEIEQAPPSEKSQIQYNTGNQPRISATASSVGAVGNHVALQSMSFGEVKLL